MRLRTLSFVINKNYACEIDIIRQIREFSDGIDFVAGNIELALYEADHTPHFRIILVILNIKLFELNIYYRYHRDTK